MSDPTFTERHSKPVVLVADDEGHIRTIVAQKLRSAGMEVIEARDGEEALHMALESIPDAIISDYQMPFMTGVELATRLRHDPRTASVPILLLTARGYKIGDGELAHTGVHEVMSKPFSLREVLERVERLVTGVAASLAAPGIRKEVA